jgi:hypothetical protein
MAVIGASTFLATELVHSEGAITAVFFVAMGLTSLIVLWISSDVCAFLLQTGLLFEDFFRRIAGLAIPSFAFFTFYSVIVIVFAAIYRIIDRYAAGTHFLFAGEPRDLSFIECLYFSIITLSTVGYGDLVPLSRTAEPGGAAHRRRRDHLRRAAAAVRLLGNHLVFAGEGRTSGLSAWDVRTPVDRQPGRDRLPRDADGEAPRLAHHRRPFRGR